MLSTTLPAMMPAMENHVMRKLQLTAVCSAVLAVGFFLGISAANAGRNEVRFGIPAEEVTALEGVLLEDPRIISGGRAMATLSLQRSAGEGGLRVSASGEITVFFPEEGAFLLREFGRGTTVFTEGRLRYTDRGWTYGAVSMHIVKPATALQQMRTDIRLNLINRFDGYPWGGLSLALLLGVRDNLDSDLTAAYRRAGLSYILALSGMHLAIIASIIAFLLKKPLGLKAAAITGAVIIILYCFIVGPLPSLIRSAIMYIIGVLTILGALPRKSMSVLALSFIIQIIVSPSSGTSISFMLSYLAMVGILVITKPLASLLAGKIPNFILQPLAMSCGAFLTTAGIVSYFFGRLAPAGIIAGLLIIPATTVFMIGSILWLVLDLVSLSGILSMPLSWIYSFKEGVISVTGMIPGISQPPPLAVLIISIALSLAIIFLEHRRRELMLRLSPLP